MCSLKELYKNAKYKTQTCYITLDKSYIIHTFTQYSVLLQTIKINISILKRLTD